MKRKLRGIALAVVLGLLLTACGGNAEDTPQTSGVAQEQPSVPEQSGTASIDTNNIFSDRDRKGSYEESESAVIFLEGSSARCDSNAVRIEGSTVTVTDEGCYILRGTLDDGGVIVDAEKTDKTQLVLDGVEITNQTGAAIYVRQADKVFVTLAEGTENSLSNGGSFEAIDENNIDGVIFSKEDLTLNGAGDLSLSSPAGHGVVSKDDLTVTGGSYTVSAASHGFAGKDSVSITGAAMTVSAGKDGIHGENSDDASLGSVYIENGSFTITAEGDGISASACLQIDDGTFAITSGGGSENGSKLTSDNWGGFPGGMGGGMGGGRPGRPGESGGFQGTSWGGFGGMEQGTPGANDTSAEDSTSIKGIKAGSALVINSGSFLLNCADDGVHSNGDVTITGGEFSVATGDDGVHADGTLTVTGGTVSITESYEGLEGLHILISGGEVSAVASDDGLNAAGGNDQSGFGGNRGDRFGGGPGGMSSGNGSVVISGGKVAIQASGDGIDANGTLEITGGYTTVCGPTQGDTATLDYDRSATITGGTFIGTGASGMAQSFSGGSQGIIAVRAGNVPAGTALKLTDSEGMVLLEHKPELGYAVAILSSPDIVSGQTYTLAVGDQTAQIQAG